MFGPAHRCNPFDLLDLWCSPIEVEARSHHQHDLWNELGCRIRRSGFSGPWTKPSWRELGRGHAGYSAGRAAYRGSALELPYTHVRCCRTAQSVHAVQTTVLRTSTVPRPSLRVTELYPCVSLSIGIRWRGLRGLRGLCGPDCDRGSFDSPRRSLRPCRKQADEQ
jgi:hypothetical protein